MPELTDEQMKDLLEQLKKNFIPLSLNISKENEEKALKECDEYIKTGNNLLLFIILLANYQKKNK